MRPWLITKNLSIIIIRGGGGGGRGGNI